MSLITQAAGPSNALVVRARGGDQRARERVLRDLLPMAERVGRRFAGPQHPAEDLAQVASIGVLKAIDRFDPTHDATFATYAHALMTGEVRRHIRDSRMVRIPRSIYEMVPSFQRAYSRLRSELGRNPSNDELANALEISHEDVIQIIDAATHAQHVSLDAAVEDGGDEFDIADTSNDFDRAEAGAVLAPMLTALSPRERMILDLRFQEGLSQSEIADGLGLSQTHVSRLIRRALDKLSARAGVPA